VNNTNKKCLGDYKNLLKSFIDRGYIFCRFREFAEINNQVALRHDIDFDVELAWKAAKLEYELGVNSTYFFLLRSPFYNPFADREYRWIKEIKEMGHTISIHFDPSIYEDFKLGFKKELSVFEAIFNTKLDIISLHRPNDFFQNFDEPILGIEHTYQFKYFKKVKYISDSTGVWRYGSPLESNEFKFGKSIHLLIHPIWWFVDGASNLDVLKNHFWSKIELKKFDFIQNSLPFKSIAHEL
jgi:hypothetical protein